MTKLSGGEAYPIYFGGKTELLKIAADLRHNMTPAEKILCDKIRNRKLLGFKFRRQHPVSEIILDYYCHEARLSIEVDGIVHNNHYQKERDKERTEILNKFGIKELRFSNDEVENQIDNVLEQITTHLKTFIPPFPMRGKGRGWGRIEQVFVSILLPWCQTGGIIIVTSTF